MHLVELKSDIEKLRTEAGRNEAAFSGNYFVFDINVNNFRVRTVLTSDIKKPILTFT